MTEPRDDYLWDPQAAPDAEVEALERLLRPLGHDGRPLDAVRLQRTPARHRGPWWVLAAAAAALLLGWILWGQDTDGLAPGAEKRRYLASEGKQRVELGELAQIELEPGSELWFLHWRGDEARFQLRAGGITVRVAPPPAVQPRFFCVDTPGGSVVDLGCRYELRLRPDGSEYVKVTDGAVEFAQKLRTVFVPAGAECTVDDGWAATPLFADARPELRGVVAKFDEIARKERSDPVRRVGGGARWGLAKEIADRCRGGRDTLALWHLMLDDAPEIRAMAEARLVDLEDAPPDAIGGVSKDDPVRALPEQWLAYLRKGAWTRQ